MSLNRERFVNNPRFLKMEKTCHHPTGDTCGSLFISLFISQIEAKGSSFTMRRMMVSISTLTGRMKPSGEELRCPPLPPDDGSNVSITVSFVIGWLFFLTGGRRSPGNPLWRRQRNYIPSGLYQTPAVRISRIRW